MDNLPDDVKNILLDAALVHVPFGGWSEATFIDAIADSGIDDALARSVCPRGAVDLALAYHARGDQIMLDRLAAADLSGLKFREKIAAGVRFRIQASNDKELVRRGTALFAMPHYVADGAGAIWGTCGLIWEALGDSSHDVNWYTKRMTLSGVYSSTVLFWLGDDSPNFSATWEFLDRRIENVMQIEKLKAQVNSNPLLKPLMAAPNWLLGHIKAPTKTDSMDLPGTMRPRR
ncbi:MAG: ubiquinone biosynthesis protein COQ9 [Paracoccaceae bacterium]|jgi:ubiquinone biosynthesis protein COQ9